MAIDQIELSARRRNDNESSFIMHLKIRHERGDIADGTNKKDADASNGYRQSRSPDREKYFQPARKEEGKSDSRHYH